MRLKGTNDFWSVYLAHMVSFLIHNKDGRASVWWYYASWHYEPLQEWDGDYERLSHPSGQSLQTSKSAVAPDQK